MVDSIEDLRELCENENVFRRAFPQGTIQVKILNALANLQETDETEQDRQHTAKDTETKQNAGVDTPHADTPAHDELPEGKRFVSTCYSFSFLARLLTPSPSFSHVLS